MSKLARQLTDEQIAKLEEAIEELYGDALEQIEKTTSDYWKMLEKREATMKGRVASGKMSQSDYDAWYKMQLGRGSAFETMRDNMARILADSDASAVDMLNKATPGVYALNRNIVGYEIESAYPYLSGNGVNFALWDENVVKRLLEERPDLMPDYPEAIAFNRGFDVAWGKERITKVITADYLQGKDIATVASDLRKRVIGMSVVSAKRTARTAMGSAMNAGTMDGYAEAVSMGIKMEIQWLSGIDGRTRDSHIEMNGVRIKYGEKFPNGLRYPCDPSGKPGEVYNCRCTTIAIFPENAKDHSTNGHTVESYKRWLEGKTEETAEKVVETVVETITEPSKLHDVVGHTTKLKDSMNSDDDYNKVIEAIKGSDDLSKLYEMYADDITSIKQVKGGGCFRPGLNSIEWDYNNCSDMDKYSTVYHEYGHFFDRKLSTNGGVKDYVHYTFADDLKGVQELIPNRMKEKVSSSDEFIKALFKDKDGIKSLEGSYKGIYTKIKTENIYNKTSCIQDALEGLFNERLIWGHGSSYYNRWYNNYIGDKYISSERKKIKKAAWGEALSNLGITCKNETERKMAARIFETASELWANMSDATISGGTELEYIQKLFPNSYAEFIKIMEVAT